MTAVVLFLQEPGNGGNWRKLQHDPWLLQQNLQLSWKRETGMKSPLERLCRVLDDVLLAHGSITKTAGRLVMANGMPLSWRQGWHSRNKGDAAQRALRMPSVWATVGVVLVNDWQQRRSRRARRISGEYEIVTRPRREAVETVDVLALIDAHQAELAGDQPLSGQTNQRRAATEATKKVVPATRPLDVNREKGPLDG